MPEWFRRTKKHVQLRTISANARRREPVCDAVSVTFTISIAFAQSVAFTEPKSITKPVAFTEPIAFAESKSFTEPFAKSFAGYKGRD